MNVMACDGCGKTNVELGGVNKLHRVVHKKRAYDANRDQFVDGFSVLRRDTSLQMPQPYEDLCYACTIKALEAYLG